MAILTMPVMSAPPPSPPQIRQDLELLPGPVVANLGSTWRIRDPARNRFFDIGPFEFAVLSEWSSGLDLPRLAERVSESLDEPVTADQLTPLLRFLQENELLSPGTTEVRHFLRDRRERSKPGPWRWLLHNYLFFRVPLLNPEQLLGWLGRRTGWIYTRATLLALALLALLDMHLIFQHGSELRHHFDFSLTAEGLMLVAVAGMVSKVVHEFGHALTARRYGVRVPAMGVAFVVMYPMLYTDTSDSWRLRDKRKRLAIASAGMISEFSVALVATLLWAITPDGAVRSALFSLAFIGWLVALGLNASPFFRFDGYYILSDAVDMPNLHDRGAALARMRLRRALLGIEDPDPEPHLSARRRNLLTAFAIFTQLYRFVVFITIALFVYAYFFKLLGILLMLVELGWFVVRPVWSEASALKSRMSEMRPRWGALLALLAVGLLAAWMWMLGTSVRSPALMTARYEYFIQAPSASLLAQMHARNGHAVDEGEELIVLLSPEALLRKDTAEISRNALVEELQRTAANTQSRERIQALQSQLAGAEGTARLSARESDVLRLRAPGAGTVRDLLPEAVPGRWVRSRELLMRVVSEQQAVIHAYVDEGSVHRLLPGAHAIFYPDAVNQPPVSGRVASIDTTALRAAPSAMLASTHGGPLATDASPGGELLLRESRYRVVIEPDQPTAAPRALRGAVYIDGDSLGVLLMFPQRMLSALVREFGV